jgi:two-component sensor histidine kinase
VTFVNAVARRRAARPPEGTTLAEAPGILGETFDAAGSRVPVEYWPMARALRGETPAVVELSRVTPAGECAVLLSHAAPVWGGHDEIIGAVAICTDITASKQTERALRQALAERDTLLREIHHRTKNDLAMVAGLLTLQAEAIQSTEGKMALEESHARVRSFAILHEQLYRSLEGGRIRLAEYLGRIVTAFEGAHHVQVVRRLPQGPLFLDVDRAIPCGLIVNELLTNAVKHAFGGGQIGEIGVGCSCTGTDWEVVVWDRGIGLPAALRIEDASSLGLRLVRILLRRLSGRVWITGGEGTAFHIRFPMRS